MNKKLTPQEINDALNRDQIRVFYQPIKSNKHNKILKHEALVRIIKEGELIAPGLFLEESQKHNDGELYFEITKRVIDMSFQEFSNRSTELSFNLTQSDIQNSTIVSHLENHLIKNSELGSRLIMEITESESTLDSDDLDQFIKKFKEYNCRFAIDDFGSGHSNIQNLLKYDFDFIKIDGSVINNIDTNLLPRKILEFIKDISDHIGAETVCEFISSESRQALIQEFDIDHSQGYYIGKPVDRIP